MTGVPLLGVFAVTNDLKVLELFLQLRRGTQLAQLLVKMLLQDDNTWTSWQRTQ